MVDRPNATVIVSGIFGVTFANGLRACVHKNQTLSGKLQNFKIAQTLVVSSP